MPIPVVKQINDLLWHFHRRGERRWLERKVESWSVERTRGRSRYVRRVAVRWGSDPVGRHVLAWVPWKRPRQPLVRGRGAAALAGDGLVGGGGRVGREREALREGATGRHGGRVISARGATTAGARPPTRRLFM